MAIVEQTLEINSQLWGQGDLGTITVESMILKDMVVLVMGHDVLSCPHVTIGVSANIGNSLDVFGGWDYAIQSNSLILSTYDLGQISINSTISNRNIVETSLRINSLIYSSETPTRRVDTTYAIYFDGQDVTNDILDCKLSYSRDSYCGQIDITWADWKYFTQLDCSDMTVNYGSTRFTVYINGIHFGDFFNEKRDVSVAFGSTSPTSWGRTKPALLSSPYAKTVTEVWRDDTTALAICTDLAARGGINIVWEIQDFRVRAGKFLMNSEYPIDGIKRLIASIGGIITTSRFSPTLVIRYKWLV